jgi:hypothetical protein
MGSARISRRNDWLITGIMIKRMHKAVQNRMIFMSLGMNEVLGLENIFPPGSCSGIFIVIEYWDRILL